MPSIKEFVKRVCKKKIKNICCNSAMVRQRKHSLLHYLRYQQYRIESRKDNNSKHKDWANESIISCNESDTKEFTCHERNYYPYRIDRQLFVPMSSSRSSVDTNYLMEQYLK